MYKIFRPLEDVIASVLRPFGRLLRCVLPSPHLIVPLSIQSQQLIDKHLLRLPDDAIATLSGYLQQLVLCEFGIVGS